MTNEDVWNFMLGDIWTAVIILGTTLLGVVTLYVAGIFGPPGIISLILLIVICVGGYVRMHMER